MQRFPIFSSKFVESVQESFGRANAQPTGGSIPTICMQPGKLHGLQKHERYEDKNDWPADAVRTAGIGAAPDGQGTTNHEQK